MAGEVARQRRPRKRTVPDRYEEFMTGKLTVEDLDDEEIARMQLRSADGSFRGRPPGVIPRELATAFKREQQRRFQQFIAEAVPAAQRAVIELVNSRRLQPGDATRLKAAEAILERFAGKVPDKVEVSAEISTFESVMGEILVDIEEEDDEFHPK
jgi:polysaccharide pyruvyl transferase WcaK-like protein